LHRIASLVLGLASVSAFALTQTFTPVNQASGVSWNPDYSTYLEEGSLLAGDWNSPSMGVWYRSSLQLRYDITSLAGYTINSLTISLVSTGFGGGSQADGRLIMAELNDDNDDWDNNATWKKKNATANWSSWDAGEYQYSGGTNYPKDEWWLSIEVPTYATDPVGTVYNFTIDSSHSEFANIIDRMLNDGAYGNGLCIFGYGDKPDDVDNRTQFAADPILTVDYIPEPATLCLLAFGGAGMLVRRRRRR